MNKLLRFTRFYILLFVMIAGFSLASKAQSGANIDWSCFTVSASITSGTDAVTHAFTSADCSQATGFSAGIVGTGALDIRSTISPQPYLRLQKTGTTPTLSYGRLYSTAGTTFKLTGISVAPTSVGATAGGSQSITVHAYKAGSEIGSVTTAVLSATTPVAVTLTSSFDDIDEIRFTSSSATAFGIGVDNITTATATTITSLNRVSGIYSNASSVSFNAVFGSAVTGVTASNFSLTTSGVSGASIGTPTSSDNITWTVPVTTGTGDGSIQLKLANATGLSQGISTTLPFAGQSYTIDKTAPTISIGSPSVSTIATGSGSVTYTVTYADANFNSSTLATGNITLNTTVTASGSLAVSGSGLTRTVTISSITGSGNLGITIAAGTATDLAGNSAPAAGPSATFAVTLVSQTITFNALPTKTYGNADFAPGATSDNVNIPITYSSDNTAVATIVSNKIHIVGAGTANITASQAGDATHAAASNVIKGLTVNAASLTITADNQTKAYGAALPTLTASYSGFVNSETSASLTTLPTLSTAATASSHVAGSPYSITASGAVDANYSISYVAGTLTVTTGSLTVTANNQTKAYGAAVPTLTASYSGFVNGDTGASLTTQPTLSTAATAASHVAGSPYTITASGAVDADYSISYVAGTLTVGTAPLTITADNQAKAYGAAVPTLTASYSGFVNGDTGASLTTQPTLSTTATAASHVAGNPYTITASGAADADYAISYVPGALTVGAASLTITADNQTKAYGAAVPTLTASYSGFVNGDTGASLTTQPTLSTTATAASHVAGSPYTITASGAVDADYTISYVSGALTVGAASLTITADDQTKAYGAAVPTLTASYSGFVNGDTGASLTTLPTLSTTATAASHIAGSPYAITASGAADADYAISYVAGSLTINTVSLTITADDQTKVYGDALPTLTASYSGFVNGDTGASLTTQPTLSTTATSASAVGPYPITASGAVDADYAISYAAGTLTVTASTDATLAVLTTTANSLTPAFASGTLTYTATAPNATTSVTVRPTAADANASIEVQVNGGGYAPVSSGTVSDPLVLNAGDNPIDIQVTAQDGTTIKKYTITVNRAPSTDALLTNLKFSPRIRRTTVPGPDFRISTATVDNTINNITLTPIARDSTATIKVNGVIVASGSTSAAIPLNVGSNLVTTVITAQDGIATNTYKVTITRESSTNAILNSLSFTPYVSRTVVSGSNFRDYTATVDNSVSSITVTPVTQDTAATVKVNGVAVISGAASASIPLLVGNNTITTVVTAGDGVTVNTYSIIINRQPSTNAILNSLSFDPYITRTVVSGANFRDYTATVDNSVSAVAVTPVTQDITATVKINNVTVASGVASASIPLHVGNNTITTVVTAGDGVTVNTYSIVINRLPSTNAILNLLSFNPYVTRTTVSGVNFRDYTATVKTDVSSITVTPVTQDTTAIVKINNVTVASGVASASIPLQIGNNTITAVVTAGDGVTVNTYSIIITREANALLTFLTLNPQTELTTVPGTNFKDYTATVANSVSSVTVTPITQDPTSAVKVNNAAVASGTASGSISLNVGDNTITTVVTAANGITTNTYSIVITRQAPGGLVSLYDEKLVAVAPVRSNGIVVHQNLSPNGDGNSDVLVIDGIAAYPDNKLQIMSRNGALVYEAKGYDNATKVFDGHASTNGKLQQAGTYFYSLTYKA
ncbi:MBG domain-containing protein, partial [Mucilaginibacter sp.]|uniref:MBG domain-containing protein n=1 Tax=Mucilaginibacter sp. TaxID=1882438 RepID=UPI0026195370